MKIFPWLVSGVLVATSCFADHRTILDAIRMVESGGNDAIADPPNEAAIGPFQIHLAYWQDAVDFDKSIGGTYQDCRKREYAERIVLTYWKRYCGVHVRAENMEDYEFLARCHNGGASGWKKQSTLKYWEKVKAALERK